MLLNSLPILNSNVDCPTFKVGHEPSVLTSIYDDQTNMAIWQRQHQKVLDLYAQEWIKQHHSHTPRLILSADKTLDQLDGLLPDLDYKEEFKQDVALLVDMFSCLFDAKEIGLRISPLTKAMCPKFHVDNIPCRLITSYGGIGTEWLLEENVNRNYLGRGAKGLPDHQSGILQGDKTIQQVASQEVALLKGSGWIGNEMYGLVHRSPALSPGQTRLLLTLDFS
ncbi:MAG: hypothetical protein ACJAYV_001978 [Oleispira sp.]|jgi:hypothetical protein